MDVKVESMVDGLTSLVRVISRDRGLRLWFSKLAQKSILERRNAIHVMSARLAGMCGDASLVAALKLLAIPAVFEAACIAMRELERRA